ncbi:unnamed protein product [Orchesella dallaii]|uniref:Uncharacterized protein n=1 Tax=Orchesella dallaii TaxID=48710 RepID=A0ABP1PXJ8_9HEXA
MKAPFNTMQQRGVAVSTQYGNRISSPVSCSVNAFDNSCQDRQASGKDFYAFVSSKNAYYYSNERCCY